MIDGDLRKLLIAQIGNELAAHALYMGISVYFDRQSLHGWGKFFKRSGHRGSPARARRSWTS